MDARFMIHSPIPGTSLPFHLPAGIAYRPQWINMPNRASLNHRMRSFFSAGDSVSWMEGTGCLGDVLIRSPPTWANGGSASTIARLAAAIAQSFENARLDTFMNLSSL